MDDPDRLRQAIAALWEASQALNRAFPPLTGADTRDLWGKCSAAQSQVNDVLTAVRHRLHVAKQKVDRPG